MEDEHELGIGIVGGGQLALMLAEAAQTLDIPLHLQTPHATDPAVVQATSAILADLQDVQATRCLAERCTVISFENEWLPLEALRPLADSGVTFLPSLYALEPLICKRSQRQLLNSLHLPCPFWSPLEAVLTPPPPTPASSVLLASDPAADQQAGLFPSPPSAQLSAQPPVPVPRLPDHLRFPLMAKACRGGYDGRGTRPIHDQAQLEALLREVDPTEWILEDLVDFVHELALVACRNRSGEVRCFPLVRTQQHQQVCDWVLAPAPVDHATEAYARNVATSLLTALDYVGVLSIEFFQGPTGLLVNELAPRTHNSGHYTIEACDTSQFCQQVRIVAGLPMESTELRVPGALMVNLLGYEIASGDYAEQRRDLAAIPGATLHWYGKEQARPGRKLGHLTLLLTATTARGRALEAQRRLAEIRAVWPLPEQAPEVSPATPPAA